MERFIQAIAKKAGAAVLKKFGKAGVHYSKSDRVWDVVTKADLLSEKIIMSAIQKRYPDHGIISEESGSVREGAEYVWVIDPIDGTLNYARSVPLFGVMIGLVHNGEVILSAIDLPATNELFFAKAGRGAYVNGKRIHCSSVGDLKKAVGVGPSNLHERNARFLRNLLRAIRGSQTMIGSFVNMASSACYTAAGRRDWMTSLSGSIWDYVPAYLLLKESGCKVTDTRGRPWKFGMLEMVAANPTLHKQLLKLTKNI